MHAQQMISTNPHVSETSTTRSSPASRSWMQHEPLTLVEAGAFTNPRKAPVPTQEACCRWRSVACDNSVISPRAG